MSALLSSLPRRASFVGARSDWVAIGPDLWVATSSGLHRGRIEADGAAFLAVDDRNSVVGRFPSLREAMAGVETHPPLAAV